MTPSDITRKGIINQGGFFSPYYLFDLLSRQHADELDPEGREANRRLLRQPFRAAWAKYGESGSTASQSWTAWQRELFEALGFLGGGAGEQGSKGDVPLRPLDTPIETPRHGLVPIARAAYLATTDGRPPTEDGTPETEDGSRLITSPAPEWVSPHPLVFIDLHGFGANLDRDLYSQSKIRNLKSEITEEPIARAIEFALDSSQTRWAIVTAGDKLRLYRKGGSVARQYLEVNFPALFDADRDDEWAAFWGLFRYDAFVPDPASGKCLLDRVLEASQRHAARIAADLRENIVLAVEALIQGILDDPANKPLLTDLLPSSAGRGVGGEGLQQLFTESLYFLYRLLFILYAESRDLLPVGESPIYRDTYSVEHLREMAERPLPAEDTDKTYYIETLRTLFKMLHKGFPTTFEPEPNGDNPKSAKGTQSEIVNPKSAPFSIPPYNGQLFDPERTHLLDRCRIPDRAMRQVIRELSLSRPQRRSDRRERYSYADLGVDQLGSIYEGLLVYEPTIVGEETVVAKVKGEERLVSRAQAEQYDLPIVEGSEKHPGSFVLRLWGGRRKGSGSYYTPQEITSFLVKEALEPLVEPIVQGCAEERRSGGAREQRGKETTSPSPRRGRGVRSHPEDILEIKICDPAMGSGAFLIQACRYLAEAYGRATIAAGLDEDSRMSQIEFARYKRRVAEKCLYGVDLNPLAVELAKVSLWLETLAVDRPLTFLDAHLRCGNSLIGAPLRDENGVFTVERLSAIPDAALQEVSKEASKAQKEAARKGIQRNREEQKRLQGQKAGQSLLPGVDWGVLSLREIETALAETLTRRLDLEASDEALSLPQAVALIHHKEDQFIHLQRDAASHYRQAKQICDLWCAVWFWPEPGSEVTVRRAGEEPLTVTVPEPPTTQVFLELVGGILGTDPAACPPAGERAAYLATAHHVAEEQRFFHWELEFPELWREKIGRTRKNGGFDAVVGNPPWEAVKPKSQEFWSNHNPLFKELGKQSAIQYIEEMRQDSEINFEWLRYSRELENLSNYLKLSGSYQHQGTGDLNTYKLFVECIYSVLARQGNASVLIPTAFNTDLGVTPLRQLMMKQARVRSLFCFSNERFMFPAVVHNFKFALLTFSHSEPTPNFLACFRYDVREAIGLDEVLSFLTEQKNKGLQLNVRLLEKLSPDTLTIMEFKHQKDIDVASTIYDGHSLLGEQLSNIWNVSFASEFHLTNDSHFFNEDGVGLPLMEGRMIYLYDNRLKSYVSGRGRSAVWDILEDYGCREQNWRPQWWVETEAGKAYLASRNLPLDWRIGICDVTGPTNSRTLLTTILSPHSFAGNSVTIGYIWDQGQLDRAAQIYLTALMNSLVVDYVIRMQIKNHASQFILKKLPIVRRSRGDAAFEAIVSKGLHLICTTDEFADLWRLFNGSTWSPNLTARDQGPRGQFMAEIDALVADLYGLSEADFSHILTTFPLFDRNQPPLPGEPKSFITRDLALLELFKLRAKTPPADIVEFFAEAGADISRITGPLRNLAERVTESLRLGAVAYVPSGRGGGEEVEEVEQGEMFEEGTE